MVALDSASTQIAGIFRMESCVANTLFGGDTGAT
jgi:hypothetical protein